MDISSLLFHTHTSSYSVQVMLTVDTSTHQLRGPSRRTVGMCWGQEATGFIRMLVVAVPTARAELAAPRAPSATGAQTVRTQETAARIVEEFAHIFLNGSRGQAKGIVYESTLSWERHKAADRQRV